MFTVKKELRFNGVHNRYLVERTQGVQYSIHVSYTKLNVGDTLNVISPIANSNNKKYLLKRSIFQTNQTLEQQKFYTIPIN